MASDGTVKADRISKNNATYGPTFLNPITIASNSLIGTPQNGMVEYDGTNFYVTTGGTRYTLQNTTASLNYDTMNERKRLREEIL